MKNIEHRTFNIEHPVARFCAHWTLDVGHWTLNVLKFILIFAIRLYQLIISPALTFLFGSANGCRFTPTCSQYAIDAIRVRGAIAGSLLAAKRICRCHPFGGCGHDPVEKSKIENRTMKNKPAILHSSSVV